MKGIIMPITAFGKKVSREKAIDIIIKDRVNEYCYAQFTDGLELLLLNGWQALTDWSDKELEEYIDDCLCIENQPKGTI